MLRKSRHMLYCVAIVFGFCAAVAVAQPPQKGIFTVGEAVLLNGQQLPAGSYHVIWSGTGAGISVTVKRGHKVVVTAPARLVAVTPPTHNTVLEDKNSDGLRSISEIQFRGENYALRLELAGPQSDSLRSK